ncbi:MAG: hypothetical protein AB7O67_09340 [Vicinamibacterales bacterium]
MDVFLIPTSRDRYELYFEAPDADVAEAPHDRAGGFFSGVRRRFAEMLREAEAPPREADEAGGLGRLQRRLMCFISERVQEQRLLWRLRHATAVDVHVPNDMTTATARQVVLGMLQRDADRHLRWGAVHVVGLLASAPLMFVPGPNVVGYFFTFTVVGHFLAWRGARRGLSRITWQVVPNDTLAEFRVALRLTPPERRRRIAELAGRLRLERLPRFFERIAVPTA